MIHRWLKGWVTQNDTLRITLILHRLQLAEAGLGCISVVTEIKGFGTVEIIHKPGDRKNIRSFDGLVSTVSGD